MEPTGERLKKLRLEKGVSLEEAQKKTKININILRAIEGDGLTDLSPVYLKGFIRIYSKFLGFDSGGYVSERKEPQDATTSHVKAIARTAAISSAAKDLQNKDKEEGAPLLRSANPVRDKATETFDSRLWQPVCNGIKVRLRSSGLLNKIKMSFIFVLIIVIGMLSLFMLGRFILLETKFLTGFIFSKGHKAKSLEKPMYIKKPVKAAPAKTELWPKSTEVTKTKDKKSQITPMRAAQDIPKPETPAVTSAKETISGIRLGVRTRENCWVSLKIDGRLVFQKTLEKGRYESWQAKDKIELSLGNAGVVELEVNGQIFSKLGKKGQSLKNILITKEGMSIKKSRE